tara:strand:- start:5497 stop:5766 length:270 start_codon:yes stop_codon:yes gene_type:complete
MKPLKPLFYVANAGIEYLGHHYDITGKTAGLYGNCRWITGDVSGVTGNCTQLWCNCTGIFGDLDSIPLNERCGGMADVLDYIIEVEVDG